MFVTVLALSMMLKGLSEPSPATNALTSMATIIGNTLDFPYSPIRLAVLMLPADSEPVLADMVRSAAGISYVISLLAIVLMVLFVRLLNWPVRKGAFNVWVNLPLFDPTAGGDVLERLHRDARVNIAIGFLLPFIIPAVVKAATDLIDPMSLNNPQTIIWTISAWAFIPASMIMRGIAMARVAEMIQQKRRRTYANADAEDGFQTA
jgi:hypothetical protein